MQQTKKGFNCSITSTSLQFFILTKEEVKELLDKKDYEEINEKDWNMAAEIYTQNYIIEENDISNVKNIEIEEVWHN